MGAPPTALVPTKREIATAVVTQGKTTQERTRATSMKTATGAS